MMKYLAAGLTLLSLTANAELTGDTTKWETESEIDAFTDERRTSAMITAEGGFENGFIHVGCYPDGGFEAKVGTGEYIGDKDIHNNVLYRVDKNEPVEMTMKATDERYVYFNDMSSQFLKDLMNGIDTVVIRLTSYDFDRSQAKFSLNGSKAAIQSAIDACTPKSAELREDTPDSKVEGPPAQD